MSVERGTLLLTQKDLTYFAGSAISGIFKLDVQESTVYQECYVQLTGECNMNWRHLTTQSNTAQKISEVYCEEKINCFGADKEGNITVDPDLWEFPFKLVIPASCPSSIECCKGSIRYMLEAIVDAGPRGILKTQQKIIVQNLRNLNKVKDCKNPMVFGIDEIFSICCLSKGTCKGSIKLARSGYCPGQSIPIEMNCENMSSVKIDYIKFELIEKMTFRVRQRNFHETTVIVEMDVGPIEAYSKNNWAFKMQIPKTALYNVDNCRYIDVYHLLRVTVVPSGSRYRGTVETRRITLGDIPFKDDKQMNIEEEKCENSHYILRYGAHPGSPIPAPELGLDSVIVSPQIIEDHEHLLYYTIKPEPGMPPFLPREIYAQRVPYRKDPSSMLKFPVKDGCVMSTVGPLPYVLAKPTPRCQPTAPPLLEHLNNQSDLNEPNPDIDYPHFTPENFPSVDMRQNPKIGFLEMPGYERFSTTNVPTCPLANTEYIIIEE